MITIFKNNKDKTPQYTSLEKVLKSISSCGLQNQIDAIRNELDRKKQNELKGWLPSILWSGEFSNRNDNSILSHSGIICLDFDKLKNLEEKTKELKQSKFCYALFISPSGNGLKMLVKVPPIKEKHRGYWRGLKQVFPEIDTSCINEARICYASADKDLFINEDAEVFDTHIADNTELDKKALAKAPKTLTTNYSKVNISLEMVRNANDGQKHTTLLKASKLMGGYIATGAVDESEAKRLLEYEIGLKKIDDIDGAIVTIAKGIEYGKSFPIEVVKYEQPTKALVKPKVLPSIDTSDDLDFLADNKEIDEYLNRWRLGTFEKGVTTGIPTLDVHYVFKLGNFNVFNGFDNVGKSTTLWYLALLSAMYHNWKWIIYSSENKNGNVIKKLIEFYWGERIDLQNTMKYKAAKDFVLSHFTIINNEKMYNFKDILVMVDAINEAKDYHGVLIDPYNALRIDLDNNSKLNTHEYHYEAASEMQLYAKKNNICVYLNCHVVTSAMRNKTAPMKADTEGGGKFANKADDFVTIHRETQSADNWMDTELHIRKIKEIETGGSYTKADAPYVLTMHHSMCIFKDKNGFDAVHNFHYGKNEQPPLPIQPNTSFDSEKPTSMKDEPYFRGNDFIATEDAPF